MQYETLHIFFTQGGYIGVYEVHSIPVICDICLLQNSLNTHPFLTAAFSTFILITGIILLAVFSLLILSKPLVTEIGNNVTLSLFCHR